jgi:acetylornithine deacetylase/succinyl-diaminopimelate desuccinylase-like protein
LKWCAWKAVPADLPEIPAGAETGDDTILLYGHLDKQPEMTGWDDDLGPWTPVLRGDKLLARCRRRLRHLRLAGRGAGAAGPGPAARPLRGA